MTIIQWAGSPVPSFRDLGFKEVRLPKTRQILLRNVLCYQ